MEVEAVVSVARAQGVYQVSVVGGSHLDQNPSRSDQEYSFPAGGRRLGCCPQSEQRRTANAISSLFFCLGLIFMVIGVLLLGAPSWPLPVAFCVTGGVLFAISLCFCPCSVALFRS